MVHTLRVTKAEFWRLKDILFLILFKSLPKTFFGINVANNITLKIRVHRHNCLEPKKTLDSV